MKNKLWKLLAAAGSFVVLANGYPLMKPYAVTGDQEQEYLVAGPEQCRRLLMEIVSGAETGSRKEYWITGIDYEPETLVIAQMFPDAVNISNTVMKEYCEGGHRYVTCRIGFERTDDDSEMYENDCEKEDLEEEEIYEGNPNGKHWTIGNLRSWEIGNETYVFRCIDEDYRGSSEEQPCALFLCETVIRSDVISSEKNCTDDSDCKVERLIFGENNNYKTSDVREWLCTQAAEDGNALISVNTGVNAAYLGATVPGTFASGSMSGLLRHELCYQLSEDDLFILSLEEAIRYKEYLWDVDGGNSAYSRGYWLRTPAFSTEEDGSFCYGNWIYAVDLEQGCLRPVNVKDGSIGIRPVFCLPQA